MPTPFLPFDPPSVVLLTEFEPGSQKEPALEPELELEPDQLQLTVSLLRRALPLKASDNLVCGFSTANLAGPPWELSLLGTPCLGAYPSKLSSPPLAVAPAPDSHCISYSDLEHSFIYPPTPSLVSSPSFEEPHSPEPPPENISSVGFQPRRSSRTKMPKKHRSLHNILIPSFLHTSIPSTSSPSSPSSTTNTLATSERARARSLSEATRVYHDDFVPPPVPRLDFDARSLRSTTASITTTGPESPPSYLLDDDPFANYSPGPSVIHSPVSLTASPTSSVSVLPTPRSPLSPNFPSPPSPPNPTRPALHTSASTSALRPPASPLHSKPAHMRPAFSSRPSLPSLSSLAQESMAIPKKPRKGKVGARLPLEPWSDQNQSQSEDVTPKAQDFSASGASNDLLRVEPVANGLEAQSQFLDVRPVSKFVVDFPASRTPSPTPRSIIVPSRSPSPPPLPPKNQPDFTLALSGEEPDVEPIRFAHPPEFDEEDEDLDELIFFSDPPCPPLTFSRSSDSDDCSTLSETEVAVLAYSVEPAPSSPSHSLAHDGVNSESSTFNPGRPSSMIRVTSPLGNDADRPRDDQHDQHHDPARQDTSLELSSPESPLEPRTPTSNYYTSSTGSNSGSGSSESRYRYCPSLAPSSSSSSSPLSSPVLPSRTPYPSIYSSAEPEEDVDGMPWSFQSGPPASTIRAAIHSWNERRGSGASKLSSWTTGTSLEVVEGGDWGGRGAGSGNWQYGGSGGRVTSGRGYNQGSSGAHGRQGGSGSAGDGRGGRDGDDRRAPGSSFFDDLTDSETETSEDEEEEEEEEERARSRNVSNSDDDVPLAQRIPGALKAQRTIRRQFKDERRQKERSAGGSGGLKCQRSFDTGPFNASGDERGRSPGVRTRTNTLRRPGNSTLSPEHAVAVPAIKAPPRPRTKTMPGSAPRPFAAEDLTKKLLNVQITDAPPSATLPRSSRDPWSLSVGSKSTGIKSADIDGSMQRQVPVPDGELRSNLRHMRSFHRTPPDAPPVPSVPSPELSRHPMSGRPRRHTNASDPRTFSLPATERPPPMPPLPPAEALAQMPAKDMKVQLTQQRVFVGDLQRFNTVEIGPSTTAEEVLLSVARAGGLDAWQGVGDWMLFEVASDFGMERPIRSFELVNDVFASWNKDKMVNMLLIKRTPLEPTLRRSALPSSSPTQKGYVEWESKRGKWTKRWVELREHSLWLAKNDKGKDETFLCSLSNFDAYQVTRIHKAPKPFVFAIKSTDNLAFFEDTADYLHVFCCNQRDGELWMQKILLARSYVLHQERNVLMAKANVLSSSAGPGSRGLSRANTRRPAPAQPLLNAGSAKVFEPGSLLAQR